MASRSNVDLQELSKHFGSPEKEVAKSLGMCLTSLKKICRQHGINRWPYRKVGNHPLGPSGACGGRPPPCLTPLLGGVAPKMGVASPKCPDASQNGGGAGAGAGAGAAEIIPSADRFSPSPQIKSLDVKLKKLEVAMSTTKEDPSMVYAQWATSSERSATTSGSHTPSSATSELCSVASTPRQQSVENVRMPSPEPADVDPRVETLAMDIAVFIQSDEHGFRPVTPQPPSLISAPISMPYVKDDSDRDDRSPSPEAGQSDEDIIAMLAECAGSGSASALALSEPTCHSADYKQGQQQLSDGDIMAALASCCALPCMEDEELDSCLGSDAEGDGACDFDQPAFQSIDPDALV